MIPWAKPEFFGRENEYVSQALASSWISGGPFVDRFEAELSSFLDVEFALVVANGTAALHLAYLALGLDRGDEIIVPGFAYQAAANIAMLCGVRPVFVEVDPLTWCLNPRAVEEAITPYTKAVVPIHTYGNVADMSRIIEISRARKIAVVEDAAEAFASRRKGRQAGTFGTVGTFSFHATKTISTGEGGMVSTDDPELAARMRLFRSHGMTREKRYYWHEVPGHNFRLTNLQAALGCAQLEKIEEIRVARQRAHESYVRELSACSGIMLQQFDAEVTPVLWAMAAKLDPKAFPQGRDEVIMTMLAAGIECRPGFYAASQQPIYGTTNRLSVCEELGQQIISLPMFASLTEEQIQFICRTLVHFKR